MKQILCLLIAFSSLSVIGQPPAKRQADGVEVKPSAIKDKIVEGGVEYYRVKTLDQLKQIGFTITTENGQMIAAAKGHRGGRNSCCNFNSGRCSSLLKVSGNDITSADFIEEEGPNGKIIKSKKGLIPYYNGKTNKDVLFR